MLTWVRGSICVFPQDQQDPVWVPEHLTRKAQYEKKDTANEEGGAAGDPHDVPDATTGNVGAEMGNPISVPETDASSP